MQIVAYKPIEVGGLCNLLAWHQCQVSQVMHILISNGYEQRRCQP